jgi:hypothetical protein
MTTCSIKYPTSQFGITKSGGVLIRQLTPQPIWRFLRQNYAIYPPAVISLKVIGFPHVADCYSRAHEIMFGVCGFRQRSPEPLDGYINEDFSHVVQLPCLDPQRSYPASGTALATVDCCADHTARGEGVSASRQRRPALDLMILAWPTMMIRPETFGMTHSGFKPN